jgi:hypothetical protein
MVTGRLKWRIGLICVTVVAAAAWLSWSASEHVNSTPARLTARSTTSSADVVVHGTMSRAGQTESSENAKTGRSPFGSHLAGTYQLMSAQFKENSAASGMVAALAHAHNKVADAKDEPDWARPMERHMLEAIWAEPSAAKLEIRDVSCRSTGCEVELFETLTPASAQEIPAWFQVIDHIRHSPLGASIEMDANFGTRYDDRVMYVTTFKRKPDAVGSSQ